MRYIVDYQDHRETYPVLNGVIPTWWELAFQLNDVSPSINSQYGEHREQLLTELNGHGTSAGLQIFTRRLEINGVRTATLQDQYDPNLNNHPLIIVTGYADATGERDTIPERCEDLPINDVDTAFTFEIGAYGPNGGDYIDGVTVKGETTTKACLELLSVFYRFVNRVHQFGSLLLPSGTLDLDDYREQTLKGCSWDSMSDDVGTKLVIQAITESEEK